MTSLDNLLVKSEVNIIAKVLFALREAGMDPEIVGEYVAMTKKAEEEGDLDTLAKIRATLGSVGGHFIKPQDSPKE
jgi:hypothetical protein